MEAMNQNRATKAEEIKRVRETFDRSVAAVLVDFRGISVEHITELRARFRQVGVEYRVIKNTLIEKALEGTPLEGDALKANLKGPTGVAWSFEDPSAAAKVIKAFRKEGDDRGKLTVKCGLLESSVLSGERVENELATLPGKNELRAMLLATMMAPAQSLVRQLAASGQNFAYVLDARKRQLESNQ